MADVDTQYLSGQHSDIRREQAEQASQIRREGAEHYAAIQLESMKGFDRVNADVLTTAAQVRAELARGDGEIIKEGMRGDFTTQKAITDSLAQVSNQVDAFEDVTNANFMTVSRDTQDIRAQVISQQQQLVAGFSAAAKDSEINALKTQIEIAKQTTYLSDKIDSGNERTVQLLNTLKEADLNRMLIERNSELVEERHGRRHYRDVAAVNQSQGQWAALNSQLQAFGSQLQEARQGMVNFGTMAGVGQTSSQNNL